MYEGPIEAAGKQPDGDSPELRHLRWADLVARLAATRELRLSVDQCESASFGEFSSLRNVKDGEQAVNHEGSSHGKGGDVTLGNIADQMPKGY